MDNDQSLSQLHDISGVELQSVATKMKEYVSTENEAVLSEIQDKLKQRPGLIGVLFPGKLQREYDKLSVQKMKDFYATQKIMTEAYTNTLIELAKKEGDMAIALRMEQYGNVLSAVAMENRKKLTTLAQININEMSETFEKSRTPFLERIERQVKEGEKYKNIDFLYNSHLQSLKKETEIFMATIEELLQGFKDALKKKLDSK
ncbi:hypothetical protein FACS189428_5030 [Clostridia bacterium]|nr:hypothetical protein FACS189428_5030 [Clostridia bacterium]